MATATWLHCHKPLLALIILIALLAIFRENLRTTFITLSLFVTWKTGRADFYLSQEKDSFDVTFANYSINQQSALPDYPDLIPPILHQISLGHGSKDAWINARNDCLQHHVEWETHFWTDENAGPFVEEKFPHLKKMWESYRYPIQRVDALRYMVLYEYGGAVLDMDLDCRRSLGPLRRFEFVSPGAHPVGFSNGMMMASKRQPFVGELVSNLPKFNLNWFGLPYATVMFSTGCHYASVIHSLQSNRSKLKILAGPKEDPLMHRLNGDVVTPLFHHLGASSWHSFDAALIVSLGKIDAKVWSFGIGFILFFTVLIISVWAGILRARVLRLRASPFRRPLPSPDVLSERGDSFEFKRA